MIFFILNFNLCFFELSLIFIITKVEGDCGIDEFSVLLVLEDRKGTSYISHSHTLFIYSLILDREYYK